MRLIDADTLLQHTYSAVVDGVETDIIDVSNVDNAPTVEAKTTADCIIAYGDGYETARRLSERPQGEWGRHDEWRCGEYIGGFYHVGCPAIEKEDNDAVYSKWTSDFCPNCGTKMSRTFGGES